ncbi:MAG: YabP/YqfC family sporulation protein [Clostridia bacterium]|nr:YabP/YqfC family sporulation protein [Clostridia bacterium]
MPVYNDIIIKAGLPLSDSVGGEKISVVDFSAILVEGHKGVFSYSTEEIVVQLKMGRLSIGGRALQIVEINCDELYVSGEIIRLEKQQ